MLDDIVVGAGIAGLTAAARLASAGREVVVLDAAPRAGGVVRTKRVDGLVLEQGPQSALATDEVLDLFGVLGLREALVVADATAARRYVLHDGALVELPSGLGAALRSPVVGPAAVARALAEPLVRARAAGPESVAAFLTRRVGAWSLPLLEAAVGGVLAGDPAALDAEASFGDLVRAEREHGSVVLGMLRRPARRPGRPRGSVTLRGGLQGAVDALVTRLGPRLRTSAPVEAIRQEGDGWRVGNQRARRLWLATSPRVTARLLGEPALDVPHAPVAAVHLAFRAGDAGALPGFGWLARPAARRDALGCLWVSSIFPSHAPGKDLVRVMIGGARAPELVERDEAWLTQHALDVLRDVQGVRASPVHVDVARHRAGIPQYPVGHAEAVRALTARHPGVRLLGWGTAGIGLTHVVRDAFAQTR